MYVSSFETFVCDDSDCIDQTVDPSFSICNSWPYLHTVLVQVSPIEMFVHFQWCGIVKSSRLLDCLMSSFLELYSTSLGHTQGQGGEIQQERTPLPVWRGTFSSFLKRSRWVPTLIPKVFTEVLNLSQWLQVGPTGTHVQYQHLFFHHWPLREKPTKWKEGGTEWW